MSKEKCGNCNGGWCVPEDAECLFVGCENCCPDYRDPDALIVHNIAVDLIDPHPDNPRKSELDVEELAASIKAEGIQQPLTMVPHIGGYDGRYTCVIGHRRLAAAKKAGMVTVPAFIRTMDRREQLRTMMTENTQRRDLTPLEQADGFEQLMLELPEQTVAAVARETGVSETTVRRRMKLLELPRELMQQAEERNVRVSDYEKLNELSSLERRAKVLEKLGTPEFASAFSYQKNEERREKGLKRLTEALDKKGAVGLTREQVKERTDLEHDRTIRSWELEDATIGGLERDRAYFYVADEQHWELMIYKVIKAEPAEPEAGTPEAGTPKKSDVELAREELERKRRDLSEELTSLELVCVEQDQEILDRHEEFISGFSTFERNREEIMEAAVMMLIRGNCWSDEGLEELSNWLGGVDVKDPDELARCIRGNPEKALLYTLYVKAERDACGHYTCEYYGSDRYRRFREQPRETLLEDVLRVLGYRPSGDEMLMRGGAHHLQGQAEKLIEQFKRDKKALDKRIKV